MNSLRLRRAAASALRRWRASRSGSAGLSAVSDRVPVPAWDSSPPNSSLRILSICLASLVCDACGNPAHHPITLGGPDPQTANDPYAKRRPSPPYPLSRRRQERGLLPLLSSAPLAPLRGEK